MPGTSSSCCPPASTTFILKIRAHALHRHQASGKHLCRDKELFYLRNKAYDANQELNAIATTDKAARESKIRQLLGKVGSNPFITPPFACDYGCHINAGTDCLSPNPLSYSDVWNVSYHGDFVCSRTFCANQAQLFIDCPDMTPYMCTHIGFCEHPLHI